LPNNLDYIVPIVEQFGEFCTGVRAKVHNGGAWRMGHARSDSCARDGGRDCSWRRAAL